MAAEWPCVSLRDCGRWLSGGTPSKQVSEYWGGDLPWVTSKDLYVRYVDGAEQTLSEEGAASGIRTVGPDALLIVVRSMALTKGLMLGLTRRRVAFNQDVKALLPHEGIVPRFLLLSLWGHHEGIHALIDEASHGTKRLRTEVLQDFQIPLPRLSEQRAIARILGALDDKIESNTRAESLLSAFLEVEHHRRCALDGEWVPISELGLVSGGGTPSSKVVEYWEPQEVPWMTPSDMTALDGSPVVWSGERAISAAGLSASSAKLLPSGTVLFTSRATLGLIAITQQTLATNQGFISVTPVPPFSSAFVYTTLRHRSNAIESQANGSTFREVNKTNFKSVRFLRPPDEALQAFDAVAEPMLAEIAGLVRERKALTNVRDALLPKLVSGQIRVPLSDDFEEQVGVAVEALT